jgi:hypothetical protein
MTSIGTGRMPIISLAAAVALLSCTLLAAPLALAQEAPPTPGDVPQTGTSAGGAPSAAKDSPAAPDAASPPPRDVDLIPPRRGTAGMWRPTDIKAPIAKTSGRPAGLPANTSRIAPLPTAPATHVATPRNAIGISIPPRSPSLEPRGITPSPGTRLTTGAAATGGTTIHPTPVPANGGGQAMRGAAINGTTMARVASAPASIGGPAKDRSGINGTLLKPKH